MKYIPIPESPTPAWLTSVLRQSNILREGEAITIERQTTGAFNSSLQHLLVHYSADASPGAPTRLVLKQNINEAWAIEAGAEEVKFYNTVASLGDHPAIIPPCYAAAYDEPSGASYLLLHDLSETHAAPDTREQQVSMVDAVPAAAYIEAVVDTLARLHAYWWQHPLLEKSRFEVGYWTRNAERFAMYLQRRKVSWDDLLAQEGSWFPGELRELYEQVLGSLPSYWQRHLASRFRTKTNLTLIHGDAYFSNFLCPKQTGTGPTYLLDWQSPTFDLAGYDLVNLIATFWTPARRQEDGREQKMLRRYYAALRIYGVQHYSWEDLITDYKHGLIFWLLMPIQDRYGSAGKSYWWPKMQCLVGAFRDWHCDGLLGLGNHPPGSCELPRKFG